MKVQHPDVIETLDLVFAPENVHLLVDLRCRVPIPGLGRVFQFQSSIESLLLDPSHGLDVHVVDIVVDLFSLHVVACVVAPKVHHQLLLRVKD